MLENPLLKSIIRFSGNHQFKDGKSYLEIAKNYGVTRQRVQQVYKRLNINIPSIARRNAALIEKLYTLGATSAAIASRMKCTPMTVLNILHQRGVKTRRRGRKEQNKKD